MSFWKKSKIEPKAVEVHSEPTKTYGYLELLGHRFDVEDISTRDAKVHYACVYRATEHTTFETHGAAFYYLFASDDSLLMKGLIKMSRTDLWPRDSVALTLSLEYNPKSAASAQNRIPVIP